MFTVSEAIPFPAQELGTRLHVVVLFTTIRATVRALQQAGRLANRLHGRITLFVPRVVPFPLSLETSAAVTGWSERRFRVIAGESRVETTVQIQLCRDRFEAVAGFLAPGSLIVLGGKRRRFWPTPEQRLARRLQRAGHEAILADG